MIQMIIKSVASGEIKLPKAYRDKLGITSNTSLQITLEPDAIVVKPLTPRRRIPKNYLKMLQDIQGTYWTQEDDRRRKAMEDKETQW